MNEGEVKDALHKADMEFFHDIFSAIVEYKKRLDLMGLEKADAESRLRILADGLAVTLSYYLARIAIILAITQGYDREKFILYANDILNKFKRDMIKLYENDAQMIRNIYETYKEGNCGCEKLF